MIGKAESHVAPRAGEHVHQQAKARRTPVDVLEHDARPVLGSQNCFSGEPDILLPVGAAHYTHFAEPLGLGEPFAQIVIGDASCVVQTHTYSTSGLILANLTTFAHLSISLAMNLPKSAGEPVITMAPKLASCALSFGSASAALVSRLSLSTISVGVCAGAPMPAHEVAS